MEKKYEIKSWRQEYDPRPDFRANYEFLPTTKIFDQLTFVGDPCVCCFLYETTEGLILIDAMKPQQKYLDAIVKGIADIGYELSDLKAILITHGHNDHYGLCDELRKLSGAKIYMSEEDYHLARTVPMGSPVIEYEIDGYLTDGMDFCLGDSKIHCVLTNGHTPGCMSFIIPVTDEGRPHNIALWGGTGLIFDVNCYEYLLSVDKFSKVCDEYNVEGAISNHPTADNGVLKTALCREIYTGVPNPYLMTHEQYKRYEHKFRIAAYNALKRGTIHGVVPPRGQEPPAK